MHRIYTIFSNPRNLFLLDGIGALVSALSLGFILPYFPNFFQIPQFISYPLSIFASFLSIYSLTNFFINPKQMNAFLKIISILNLVYCVISLGLMLFYWNELGKWGISYMIMEKGIVIPLALWEMRVS